MSRTLQWSVLLLVLSGCALTAGPQGRSSVDRVDPDAADSAPVASDAAVADAGTRPQAAGSTPSVVAQASRDGANGPGAEAIALLERLARVDTERGLDAVLVPGRPTWQAARAAVRRGDVVGELGGERGSSPAWSVESSTADRGHGARAVLRRGHRRIAVQLSAVGGRTRIVELTALAPAAAAQPGRDRSDHPTGLARRSRSDATGGGILGGGTLGVGLTVVVDGHPGVPAGSGTLPRPYRIVATPAYDANDPLAGLCPNAAGWSGFGWWWTLDTVDRVTGSVVATRAQCVAVPGPGTIGPGPVPVQPPTIGEVWDQVALGVPMLRVSPAGRGVTGLDTRLWAAGPSTVRIAVAIGPWRAVGVATRVGYALDAGDGVLHVQRDGGSSTRPAFHHTFERTGRQRLVLGSVWTATVTLSGPGLPGRATPIGTAVLGVATDYPVDQIRSVLVG